MNKKRKRSPERKITDEKRSKVGNVLLRAEKIQNWCAEESVKNIKGRETIMVINITKRNETMILIVHRKNFNYINIKHSTIQYIRIKLLTTSHGQNETFETFSNKNKNSRSKKKKIPREILTMDFPSALGCSRLPAKVRTYKIYSYRVKLRKSRKERKFQRKPMEGIEEDIRWSGGNKRKMKLL